MSEESLLSSRSPQRLVLFRNLLLEAIRDFILKALSLIIRKGGGGESHSLPLLKFSRFSFFGPSSYLPIPALHWITAVFRLIKRIRNLGFWQAMPKRIILDNSLTLHFSWAVEVTSTRWTSLQASFHWMVITVWPSILSYHYVIS